MPDLSHPFEEFTEDATSPNIKLLQALNAAAASIQRSARSEQDVFKAFNQQVRRAGFHGTLTLLDSDSTTLTIAATTQTPERDRWLEALTGRPLTGYQVLVADFPEMLPVIQKGNTLFLPNFSSVVSRFIRGLPSSSHDQLLAKYGGYPAFFSPLHIHQKIGGVFHIFGAGLTQVDQPTIEVFASHISAALENAQLFSSLQDTELLYRSLYESSAHGILTADPQTGLILSVNPRLVEMTGISQEKLIGRYLHELHPAASQQSTQEILAHAAIGLEIVFDMPLKHPNGRVRMTHASVTHFETNNQHLLQVIFYDITDLKELQTTINDRAREADMLRQATTALTSSLELDQVLDQILINLEQVVPFDSAAVFLFDNDTLLGMASRGRVDRATFVGQRFDGRDGLFLEILGSQRPLILEDASLEPRFHRWAGTEYVHGWMGTPMIVRGEVIGYLTCDNQSPGIYTTSHAQLAMSFAAQAGIAIENARLFQAQKQELLRSRTLQQVGALLTSELSLQEVLESLLMLLGNVIPYDSISFQLVDANGELEMAAGRGFPDYEAAQCIVRELSHLSVEEHWTKGHYQVISDTHQDERWMVYPGTEYIRSWIGAPLVVKGRFIGTLCVDSRTAHNYDAGDGETVMAFANQAAIAIENARLFDAEHQARLRAETLRDAAQAISSSLSLPEVLFTVLERLSQVLCYDSGNVMLVQGNQVHMHAWRGYEDYCDPGIIPQVSFTIESKPHLIEIIRQGKSCVVPDTTQDPTWSENPIGGHVRSWLGTPIKARGEVIGLLSLDRVQPGPFSSDEVYLTEAFAIYAATAIENARLYEDQGQRAVELEAIRRASLSLTSSLDLHDVLDSILKHTLGLLPDSQNSHIFLYEAQEQGKLTFAAALWADGGLHPPYSEPRENGLTYSVARSGEIVVIPDMSNHPLFQNIPADWKGALIGMPLKFGGRVIGVMNIAFKQPRHFSDNEIRMIRLLGDQAAIAIENARLFQQAATERRHLSLLYQIGRDVISSLDPDEVLERAIALTCQVLGGIVGQAFIYLPTEDQLSVRALYGRPLDMIPHLELTYPLKPGLGLAGWVAKMRQPVFLTDVRNDARWMHVPGVDDDVRSAITAPIQAGDELLGVLSVSHDRAGAFSEHHLELMMAICQEVGLALSNARRYQEVQRRLAEMTLIQNLTQTLNQRLELHQMLNEIARQLSVQGGYELVRIYLVENDQPTLAAQHGAMATQASVRSEASSLQRVIENGQATIQTMAAADDDSVMPVSWACAPIFRQAAVTGAICIASQQPNRLNSQDIDLLQVLAGQMSVALENARLYEQIRSHADELEVTVVQRTTELTELYELSQEIGFSLSYDDLLQLLLRRLQNAFRSEVVAGYLSPTGLSPMTVTITRPVSTAAVNQISGVLSEILQEYDQDTSAVHELNIQVVKSDEQFDQDSPQVEQLTTFITAPVFTGKRLAGLLILASEQTAPFGAEQYRLLNTFANQARTAVQRMQAILAAQQEHLERLVENIPIGTVLLDENLNILVTNPLGQEILAVLSDQPANTSLVSLGGLPVDELTTRQDHPLPVIIELDGLPRRVFEAQIRPVQGEIHQWVLTLREVTRERENQERIQSQERLATVGQLAAGIAHDFNNIMAAILVYADLLRTDPQISTASREKLNIIEQQIQRAASLIRQILDFSRRSVMEQTDIDLLPFIKELDLMLGRVLPETIHLELNYQPGTYMVNVDPTRLQQVFMNLALNARDAMPQGGVLQFGLERAYFDERHAPPIAEMPYGDWVSITVKDTGHGIPPEIRQHLFEPFFTTKPVGKGTGLGLAQVYGIIRHHDGFIDVHSLVGVGTTLQIYLPALAKTITSEPPEPLVADLAGTGETILVVEDDAATREALQALLEVSQFNVLTASDGTQGLALYDQSVQPVLLVISDIVMPEMGGIELYRQIHQKHPETKILFITGHPLNEHDQIKLEEGSIHWLQKPFSVREFNQAIQNLLGPRPGKAVL